MSMLPSPSTPTGGHGLKSPLEGQPAQIWDPNCTIEAPLSMISPTVVPEWVDYNGHMSESCFLLVFGDQSDAFFRLIGIDEAYRQSGYSLYTVQTMIHNLREASLGDPLKLTLQLIAADDKRLHLFHSMHQAHTGQLLATGEQMLVHVDTQQARSAPMPDWLSMHVQAIVQAHAVLPRPTQVGASIGIRPKG